MPQSPLDRSNVSAHAWARYRRLMKLMGAITGAVVIAALAFFYLEGDPLPIHFYIATALGIAGAMMLMSALMGLVFLSSGTGHDEAVINPTREDDRR